MYHKIRITVVSLVVLAICVLSSTGTLSYFTDTDGATNSFMVGNASVKLTIYDDAVGGDEHIFDASEYILVDNGAMKKNCASCTESTSIDSVPFYLQAANVGNIPVFQRFRVVIPIALADALTLELPCTLNTSSGNVETCSDANYTVRYDPAVEVEGEEEPKYAEYYIVSNHALAVEATTTTYGWPVTAIRVGDLHNVTNLDEVVTCPESSSDNNDCALGIKVYSDIVQTAGFESAVAAFTGAGETY